MNETNKIWLIALTALVLGITLAASGPQTLNPFYPLDVPLNLSGQYLYDSTGDVTINDTVDLNDSHLMDVESNDQAAGSAALSRNYSNRTYLKLNGTNAMNGTLDLAGYNLTNVGGLNDCGDEEALIGNGSCRPIMNKLHEFLERDNSVGNHNISMNGQDIRNVELLDQCRLCLEQIRVDFPISELPPEDPEYRKKTCTDSGSIQEGWATLTSKTGSSTHDAFWRFKFQCGPRDTEEEEIDNSGCETDYDVVIAGASNVSADWEDLRPIHDLTDSTLNSTVYNGATATDVTVYTDTGYSKTQFMDATDRDGVSRDFFIFDPYDTSTPNTITAEADECTAANHTYGDDSDEVIACTGYFDDDGDGAYGDDLETKDCDAAAVQGSPGDDCDDTDPDVQDCDNSAPSASYSYSPTDPNVDETISFDGTGSSDSDGSISSYEWDWDNDGTYEATGSTASHSYSSSGDYDVTLRVTDDDGATDTTTQTITVGSSSSNSAPTSSFGFNPTYPDTGETVSFDGTDSSDSDGTIQSYEWDLDDDGQFDDATGSTTSYTYSSAGDYDVGLRVTDDDDATATSTQKVKVDTLAPTASFTYSPSNPNEDETITFDASGSSDDDGTIESYEWDWGDETATSGSGETDTHSYGTAGDYDVTLTVTDDDGNTDTATQAITVGSSSNSAPSASFAWEPVTPAPDETIDFTSGSSDSDGTIQSYEWDWDNDGTYEATGSTASTSYSSDGDYPVTHRVTDDDGATDTLTQTFTVESNSAPTASFTYSPDNVEPFEPFTFDAAGSSDSDGTIQSYEWDFTSDGTYEDTGSLVTHAYDSTGEYTVKLRVTDDDGATDTTSKSVTVCYDDDDDGACDTF